jgi:hypothetical protein
LEAVSNSQEKNENENQNQKKTAEDDNTPSKFVKEDSKTETNPPGSYSFFFYLLETSRGKALTGAGYSAKEHIFGTDADKAHVSLFPLPLSNGEFKDKVGLDPPPGQDTNAHYIQYQSFTVFYQGKKYDLTTIFKHETTVVNGQVTNTVTVVRP